MAKHEPEPTKSVTASILDDIVSGKTELWEPLSKEDKKSPDLIIAVIDGVQAGKADALHRQELAGDYGKKHAMPDLTDASQEAYRASYVATRDSKQN